MKPFFPQTIQARDQLTALFDFVWPTAAALWNLRWQVQGFIAEVPTATVDELKRRFLFGSGIEGVDLRRTVRDNTWDEQKSLFASFVLTNAFAVYEQWADELLLSLGMPARSGKRLQFVDQPGKPGVQTTLATLTANQSPTTVAAFFPVSSSSPKYDPVRLPQLIACYRYFKEVRNAEVHAGGIADTAQATAFAAFNPVSSRSSLGLKGDLVFEPVVVRQATRLHLRGVVGFTDVLLRLMITIDAELSRSDRAEAVLEERLRGATGAITMSAVPAKRVAKILRICQSARLPRPAVPQTLHAFMIAKGIVRA